MTTLRQRRHSSKRDTLKEEDATPLISNNEEARKEDQSLIDTSSPWSLLIAVLSLGRRLYTRGGSASISALSLQVLLLLVLLVCNTAVSLWFSFVLRSFTTALQEKKPTDFYEALYDVVKVVVLMVPAHAGKRFAAGRLSLFLLDRFTTAMFRDFFTNCAYFHLKVPNASLRLMEVDTWIQEVRDLVLVIVQNILDLLAFSSLMFFLSVRLFGALAAYSLVGTCISVLFFFPRVTAIVADVTGTRAQVTYALVRVQENKESIAFYNGGSRELSILARQMETFISWERKYLHWLVGLEAFQEAYSYATIVLPYLVVAPLYFAGEIEYGVVTQSSMAFSR